MSGSPSSYYETTTAHHQQNTKEIETKLESAEMKLRLMMENRQKNSTEFKQKEAEYIAALNQAKDHMLQKEEELVSAAARNANLVSQLQAANVSTLHDIILILTGDCLGKNCRT